MRRHSTNVRSGKIRDELVHGVTSLTPERADPGRLSGLTRRHITATAWREKYCPGPARSLGVALARPGNRRSLSLRDTFEPV
jgi:hypothetical protein